MTRIQFLPPVMLDFHFKILNIFNGNLHGQAFQMEGPCFKKCLKYCREVITYKKKVLVLCASMSKLKNSSREEGERRGELGLREGN